MLATLKSAGQPLNCTICPICILIESTSLSAAQKKKEGNPKKDFDRIEEIEMSNEKS